MAAKKKTKTDFTLYFSPTLTGILLDNKTNPELREQRATAVIELSKRLVAYQRRGYMDSLLLSIAEKKLDMINKATSKTQIKEILRIKAPRYDGCNFIASEYAVPEEELICWSETSLRSPLSEAGYRRYKEVFQSVFPNSEIFNV